MGQELIDRIERRPILHWQLNNPLPSWPAVEKDRGKGLQRGKLMSTILATGKQIEEMKPCGKFNERLDPVCYKCKSRDAVGKWVIDESTIASRLKKGLCGNCIYYNAMGVYMVENDIIDALQSLMSEEEYEGAKEKIKKEFETVCDEHVPIFVN